MRIKFINLNKYEKDGIHRGAIAVKHSVTTAFLNPSYYMLKTYFNYKSKNKSALTWLDPIQTSIIDSDVIIKEIIDEKTDILCLAFFAWSTDRLFYIISEVKRINPGIIIIAGGPDIDAHKNEKFFTNHPEIDYVVYGDGEEALLEILDSIIEKRDLDENSVNIVTK